jgi:hypothetical protein
MALCDMSWPSRIRGRSTNRSQSNDSSQKRPYDDSKGATEENKGVLTILASKAWRRPPALQEAHSMLPENGHYHLPTTSMQWQTHDTLKDGK